MAETLEKVRERPIIFSAPMVRAILEGRKTQTRRVLKIITPTGQRVPITSPLERAIVDLGPSDIADGEFHYLSTNGLSGPYRLPAAPGDRLWVQETWARYQTVNHVWRPDGRAFSEVSDGFAGYRADGHDTIEDFRTHVRLMNGCDLEHVEIEGDRWRSPIHMPRWASRITLEVTGLRVERLQEISEEDAMAEGWPGAETDLGFARAKPLQWFSALWDSIHGPGSWDANPWVAAVSFRVLTPPTTGGA